MSFLVAIKTGMTISSFG